MTITLRPREDAPRPLHQRLAGAALRAGAFGLGTLAHALALTGSRWRWVDARPAVLVVGGAALCVLLLERRDARWPAVIGRAALGGALGVLLAPLLIACATSATTPPEVALRRLAALVHHAELFHAALLVASTAPLWAILPLVRATTTRVGPQVLAGAVTGVAIGGAVELAVRAGAEVGQHALLQAACGALGGLALALVDRHLAPRVDPRAPRPPRDSTIDARPGPDPLAAWSALVLVLALMAPHAVSARRSGSESCAIGALKTIAAAQARFAADDLDQDGVADHATSLDELAARDLLDEPLASGSTSNFTYTIVRDEARPTTRWCATADPIEVVEGGRRFWTDETGAILQAPASARPCTDPTLTPGPPVVFSPVGR